MKTNKKLNKPKALIGGGYWNFDDSLQAGSTECIESEKDYFTGLYDSAGNRLYRQPNKIGFI